MNKSKEKDILVGSKTHFALRFAFQCDPHGGSGATPEEALSWGALEIWADGKNLCQHLELSQSMPSVHWYLLPLLEWLSSNWDFFLHEERLPVNSSAADAWRALEDSYRPPESLTDDQALAYEERWQGWWKRHSLDACRQGGLIPSLVFRRQGDRIEISWGDDRVTGCPDHFRFDLQPGFVRLEPVQVAEVLYESLLDGAQHLHDQMPESPRLSQLVEDISQLQGSHQRRRLGLLSGAVAEADPEQKWGAIESLFPSKLPNDLRTEVLGDVDNGLVIPGSCQAVLMFGSLSPTIDDADSRLLANELVQLYTHHGDSPEMVDACKSVPIESSQQRAWKQGYTMAEEFLDKLNLPIDIEDWIDIDAIYKEMKIAVRQVVLHDTTIRAIAIAGPRHKPTVLINSNHPFPDPERRRFTLAHELCHLLYDRAYGRRLAIASGPWTPVDVEQRANAFAAMLLMPNGLVAKAVKGLTAPLNDESSVWAVANRLKTSFRATLDHLCNLRYLSEETRDSIRTQIEIRAAATPPGAGGRS